MAGWILVRTIARAFHAFELAVPWIALVLLLFIGGKMLLEGIRGGENAGSKTLSPAILLLQGVATSIDAISVGFTLIYYDFFTALAESVMIGTVTFGICMAGLSIGRAIGTRWSGKAGILGGLILIGIGIEIFVTGLFF